MASSLMRFKDKVAVVTGGSRGIGRAIVLRLASEGGTVIFCTRRADDAASNVVAEAKGTGGEAVFIQADVTDRSQVAGFVQSVEQRFGRIDVLVNNVGWGITGPFIKSDDEGNDRTIDLCLKTTMSVTKAVLPGMVNRRYGKVVNISSEAGREGSGNSAAYGAAKAAVIAFTKTMAREMARYGINVNCVAPGLTMTEEIEQMLLENDKLAAFAKSIPLGRLATPEDTAAAVAFLAADEAAYITGQTLSVGGGATMF